MTANRTWTRDPSVRDERARGGAPAGVAREYRVLAGQHSVAGHSRMRTALHLNAHTKADRLRVAQHASSRGFFSRSDTEGAVRCPMCGQHVVAIRQIIEYKLETWGAALDGAMMAHLDDDCMVVSRPPDMLVPEAA